MGKEATISGHLRKMSVGLADPVHYALVLDQQELPINAFIGQQMHFQFTGNIECIACGRSTKKSFQQGFCFPCTRKLACCDTCIVKPELCHHHLGTCREPEWGSNHCMVDHIIYLANSSGLKIGITRQSQVPTRWIDQGAIQALPIARVETRLQSGLIEHIFKDFVADKTNWRKMLKGDVEQLDLVAERERLFAELAGPAGASMSESLAQLISHPKLEPQHITVLEGEQPIEIHYPVQQYPLKITSINLDKTPLFEAELWGIKGQYLLTSAGVINLRKYGGYQVEINFH